MNDGRGDPAVLTTPTEVTLPPGWLEGGLAVLDATGAIVEVNESLADWLNASPAPLIGRPFWDLLKQRHPQWEEALERTLASGQTLARVELEVLHGEAVGCYLLERAANAAGSLVRLSSVLPPPGELAEGGWGEHLGTEEARRGMYVRLLRAEVQLENILQRWPGVIFTQRADLSFHFVSPQIEELTGIPVEDWRRHPRRFWQVIHEADADDLRQQIRRSQHQPEGVPSTFRIRNLRTGRVSYILEHRRVVLSENGLVLAYEGAWLDVTRQTIAEKRLSSAAWKETLALLTMGLAHDFSNIMAGILALSESFLSGLDPAHPFHEGLTLIRQNSLQANQLVHRIINLHHGKTGQRQYCNLNEFVADVVDLVRKVIPRRIQVRTEPATEGLPLYVDPVDFRQVVINLSLNAADAMPQGGTLTFRTGTHASLPRWEHFRGVPPRLPAVCLSVVDTGQGIKPRHLPALFDPFFTTKAMNKGSGLGLYNARLFVDKHEGAISVESAEGQGTSFHLWLPQADFTEAERQANQPDTPRRSLLLVGHLDGTLETTAEFLRCQGYQVVLASTPENALDLLCSPDYEFVGVMIIMESKDPALARLVLEVRRHRLPVKTILQLVGCSPDELETAVLQKTDVLIAPDDPQADLGARLRACLLELPAPVPHRV